MFPRDFLVCVAPAPAAPTYYILHIMTVTERINCTGCVYVCVCVQTDEEQRRVYMEMRRRKGDGVWIILHLIA